MEKMMKMKNHLQFTCQASKIHLMERDWKKEEEEKEREEESCAGIKRMNSKEFISFL